MTAIERARRRWGLAHAVIEGAVATVAPGWWVCPTCDRRADREGERGTARRWCTGERGTVHRAAEMTVKR